jgi:hypothetical protein
VPFVVTQSNAFSTAASFQYTLNGQAIANAVLLNKPGLVQIIGADVGGNAYGMLSLIQPGINNGGMPDITFASSRSTTAQINAGTYTALQANDQMGFIDFGGDDGTNLRTSAAEIQVTASAAWSGTSTPAQMDFLTVPVGSVSPVPRMRIANSGNIGIGTTNPGATLEVKGNIKLTARRYRHIV